MVNIELKGGVVKEFDNGITAMEVAKSLGMGLYKAACVCRIDGEVKDLRTPIDKDCKLEILTFDDDDGKRALRHTASHVLAQAVKRLYPEAKLAIGPAIDNGFYYDFDVDVPFTPEVLEKIEAEMKKIVKEALPLERYELDPEEAIELMEKKGEIYKVELIKEHAGKGEKISFFRQGEFDELCAGPHVPDTSRVKAFKLTSCTGAYWRGDSDNKMLQRIYGTAFTKKEDLDNYLTMLEEAKKRDHRKLGKELGLFTIMDEGPGFPFFLPNGMILKNTLLDYWREIHHKAGYVEISTPLIMNKQLWKTSGHWDHYKDNMYSTVIDDEEYCIKPMNCPGGVLVYASKPHSYRELPIRAGEIGLVHRHELRGALHGLFRVRCFNQDDAHLFVRPDQLTDEIVGVVNLIDSVYQKFGFKYHVELSTRPEDSMGSDEDWARAEEGLRTALEKLGMDYEVNEGDGAFYGPKIDFHLEDSLGRTWQCGTVQLDFQMPLNFDLEYVDADGTKKRPIMLHRVCFGSIERFIGILIEHFAGKFPTWLAPVQVKALPVSEKSRDYAHEVCAKLEEAGIRVVCDDRDEKIGYKIREARSIDRVPYMLILGEKEVEAGNISVRDRSNETVQMSVDEFVAKVLEEIKTRA